MTSAVLPYSLSFTTGGLFAAEASVAARLFDEVSDWNAVRTALVSGEHMTFRTKATATRVSREVISRLERLDQDELFLLANGPPEVQTALCWIAACRRFEIIADFARTVIADRIATKRTDIAPVDFDRFIEVQSISHPELDDISPSTHNKLRQVLMRMMREAGFLTKSGNLSFYVLPPQVESLSSVRQHGEQGFFPIRTRRSSVKEKH